MLEMLANGVANILTPGVLACLLGGVTVGLILGAIPGLSASMAIALVIPFTYYLTPTQAIVMCLGACLLGDSRSCAVDIYIKHHTLQIAGPAALAQGHFTDSLATATESLCHEEQGRSPPRCQARNRGSAVESYNW